MRSILGIVLWDHTYSCSQHLTTPGWGGVGSRADRKLCARTQNARAHKTRAHTKPAHNCTRRWALAQRRHVSFEAIGRGTPAEQ